MPDSLVNFTEKPENARYLLAGWARQWSDGGEVSSRLPQYLIDMLGARKIGSFAESVNEACYPFQIAGTHDAFRPVAAYRQGLPAKPMQRENDFYAAPNGLVIFLGEEPWFRIDVYGQAFFEAVQALGVGETVAVEGYFGASPPDLERSVNCIYSQAGMKDSLSRLGMRFSNYGSEARQGPTIGMALVTIAHYEHPGLPMFRVGAMSPMYPFTTSDNTQVGINRDHRACHDIMKRLKARFKLDLDLTELEALGRAESQDLAGLLERIAAANSNAKEIIDRVRADYNGLPFEERVELDPALDNALEDILRNFPDAPSGR